MKIDCKNKKHDILNQEISCAFEKIVLENCLGQRFIGAGSKDKKIAISGTPGNALGAYLNGTEIIVFGNAQDATGDTMNCGSIIINGSCGDACGYAMRGGEIFVRDDVGYRAGIHMKEYVDKKPVLVIGGKCGSFLGEYQAGGLIIALGLNCEDDKILGSFCATGMHGGKIIVRSGKIPRLHSPQICINPASQEDMEQLAPYINKFCNSFGISEALVYTKSFFIISPNTTSPYKQLYVQN